MTGQTLEERLGVAIPKRRETLDISGGICRPDRHTSGHRLRSSGASLEDRKNLLGHKSNEVPTNYSLADIARLIEFVERITVRKQTFMLRPVRHAITALGDSRL
jgi:hypothetical protein